MITNQLMLRKMGNFDVIQRTKDGYFNANSLLSQWISVKDRLPKLDRNVYCDDVLIYCSDRYLGVSNFSNKEFINTEGFDVIDNVKYWMPIPKLNIDDSKTL